MEIVAIFLHWNIDAFLYRSNIRLQKDEPLVLDLENDTAPDLSREKLENRIFLDRVAKPLLDLTEDQPEQIRHIVCNRLVKQGIHEGRSAEEITSLFSGRSDIPRYCTSVQEIVSEFRDEFLSVRTGDECRSSTPHLKNRISRLVGLGENGEVLVKSKNRMTLLREKAEKALPVSES